MKIDIQQSNGPQKLLFDGRTVLASMIVKNDIDPGKLGSLLRHLARGPLHRMSAVFQQEQGKEIKVTVLVNTDEEVDVVKNRLLHGLRGNPDHLICRLAKPGEADKFWEDLLKKVHDEQQAKSPSN